MNLHLVGEIDLTTPSSQSFCSHEVYNLTKADKGLNTRQLLKLYELLNFAQHAMQSPSMAHIKIELPSSRMSDIGKILATYEKKYRFDKPEAKPLYAVKYEISPITKREHAHLYVIADSWGTPDFQGLVRDLEKTGVSNAERSKNLKPVALLGRSKKFVPERGSSSYHRLNDEEADAFLRISYISKLRTTSTLRTKAFSCSAIPKGFSVLADTQPMAFAA